MDSFKDLLAETVGQIKRANEDSAEQQMKRSTNHKILFLLQIYKSLQREFAVLQFSINGFKTKQRAFAPLS